MLNPPIRYRVVSTDHTPEARNLLGRLIERGSPQVLSLRHALANHGRPSGSLDGVRYRRCDGC